MWEAEEDMDTLEMAEEKLGFPIARPAYLPEGSYAGFITIEGYRETDRYDSVEFRYIMKLDWVTFWFTFYQNLVGTEATLLLETVNQIERVDYEGEIYLCVSRKSEEYKHNDISLHWLKDEFAYCIEISAFGPDEFETDTDRLYFENSPQLDEALRIAASLTFAEE